MPTGVEEAIAAAGAAVASFVAAGAAASPFSGPPNPGGAATAAGSSAAVADEPIIPPDVLEGTADMPAPAIPVSTDEPAGEGASAPSPVTGDRPPPGASYGRPLTEIRGQPGRDTRVEFEEVQVVARRPAQAAPDPPADEAGAPSTAPPPQTPGGGTPPAWQPSFDPPPAWHPPLAPPPGAPEAPGTGPATATDTAPFLKPAADIAADMERLSVDYPSPLVITPLGAPLFTNWVLRNVLDMSTEEMAEAAREAVSDLLTERVRATPVVSSSLPTATAGGATVAATVADVGIAMVTQALEPESVVRGVMRIGTVTPQGLRQIEEGNTAVGASAIAGEVASVVLVVLPTLKAGGSRGAKLGPQDSGTTMYVNRLRLKTLNRETRTMESTGSTGLVGHNIVELKSGGVTKITDVVKLKTAEVSAKNLPSGTRLASHARQRVPEPHHRKGLEANSVGYTPAGSEAATQKGLNASFNASIEMRHGVKGVLGPWAVAGENCSTFAATIAKEVGVAISGRLGPHFTYLQFKYLGTVEGAQVLGGVIVPGALQGSVAAGSAPPPGTQ